MQARRQTGFGRSLVINGFAVNQTQCPPLDQKIENFFAKEWISTGSLGQLPDEVIGQGGNTQSGLREISNIDIF
ncbi:MAG: hypothetical protein ORN25_11175, partial [Caulobacteraceae bacterium]|nr:hypothetical protein [Caulobacteraceae bacterium]